MPIKFNETRSTAGEVRYTTRPISLSTGIAINDPTAAKFTVAGWVYIQERNASVADFIWGESDGSTHSILLQHYNGTLYFRVKNAAGTDTSRNSTAAVITHRRWCHVAASYDPETATLIVAVDGVQATMTAGTPTGTSRTGTRWSFGTVAGAAAAEHFKGALHRWKAWNRALSLAEIQSEFAGTPVTSDLVVTYDWDSTYNGTLAAGGTSTASVQNASQGVGVKLYTPFIENTASLTKVSRGWSAVYLPETLTGPVGSAMTGWTDYHGFGGDISTANTVAPLVEDMPCRGAVIDTLWASGVALTAWGMITTATSTAYSAPTFDRRNFSIFGVFASNGRQSAGAGAKHFLFNNALDTNNLHVGVYIDGDTNKIGIRDGASDTLTSIVAPSSPFYFALVGTASGITVYVDEMSTTGSALGAGICGASSALAVTNRLYLLSNTAGSGVCGTVYALLFRSESSTAAEVEAVRVELLTRLGLPTGRPKAVVTFCGDSRGVLQPVRGRSYAGMIAKRYAKSGVVVYNMALPGRTIAAQAAAMSEVTDTQILGRASRRALVANIGGNETAWRTSATFDVDGQASWAAALSGIFNAATGYATKVFQTLIPHGANGSATADMNYDKCRWYYNEAARANTSGVLIAEIADVAALVPSNTYRAFDVDSIEPTSASAAAHQTAVQAVTGSSLYESTSSTPNLHLIDAGFALGFDATNEQIKTFVANALGSSSKAAPVLILE